MIENTTDTRHLQSVILSITKDIDRLCRENDIPYYLFGGSALGAKRHQGFIPWDDDLDIAFLPEFYDKFISLCKEKLDKSKYIIQEGGVDWPEQFSKIRLKGTHIQEYGDFYIDDESDGIFVDIFRVDNAANSSLGRKFQYLFGKLWLSYNMKLKGYKPNTLSKKIISLFSNVMRIPAIKSYIISQYLKYNKKQTNWTSDVLGRTRLHNAFIPRRIYGIPQEVKFEDTRLLAHEDLHEYLRITYGDYMKLPPEEKRKGLHIKKIDFGNY